MRIGSKIGAVLVLALSFPTPGASQDTATEVGRWDLQPTAQDFERLGPPAAVREGVSGRVTLDCELSAAGRPRDCRVKSETPAGAGFGAAAIKLGPLYKVKQTKDVELEGSRLIFIVRFTYDARPQVLTTGPSTSPPPPPVAPSAVAAKALPPAGRFIQVAIVPGWQADFLDVDRVAINGSTVEFYRLTVAAPGRDSSSGAYEMMHMSVDCTTGAQSMVASEVYAGSGAVVGRGAPKVAGAPAVGTAEAIISGLVCDPSRRTDIDALGLPEALAMARKALGGL